MLAPLLLLARRTLEIWSGTIGWAVLLGVALSLLMYPPQAASEAVSPLTP